jgi:hypothetical protein
MQAQQQRAGLQRQLTEMQKAQIAFTQTQHAAATEQRRLERELSLAIGAVKQAQVRAQLRRRRWIARRRFVCAGHAPVGTQADGEVSALIGSAHRGPFLQDSTQQLSAAHGLVKGDIEAIEGERKRYHAKWQAVKDKRAEVERLLENALPALDTAKFVAAATAECESHSAEASWGRSVL